jgi:hypothetical protein
MRRLIPLVLVGAVLIVSVLTAVASSDNSRSNAQRTESSIPRSLDRALENTFGAQFITVIQTEKVLSRASNSTKAKTTQRFEFERPNRIETTPRSVVVRGIRFGEAIDIGSAWYSHITPPLGCGGFQEITEPPDEGGTTIEAFEAFEPLLYALSASSFSLDYQTFEFYGRQWHGSVEVRNQFVNKATLVYSEPTQRSPNLEIRIDDRYSMINIGKKIEAPPAFDVKKLKTGLHIVKPC